MSTNSPTIKHFTWLALTVAMSTLGASNRSEAAMAADDEQAIRPLHVNFPEEQLIDLRKRIAATRWPGSIIEQLKLIGPLTDPTAYDGRAEDAFDVVIPSLPGYGFSGKPTTTGWDPVRIARACEGLTRDDVLDNVTLY